MSIASWVVDRGIAAPPATPLCFFGEMDKIIVIPFLYFIHPSFQIF
jgi:hypothetical protein